MKVIFLLPALTLLSGVLAAPAKSETFTVQQPLQVTSVDNSNLGCPQGTQRACWITSCYCVANADLEALKKSCPVDCHINEHGKCDCSVETRSSCPVDCHINEHGRCDCSVDVKNSCPIDCHINEHGKCDCSVETETVCPKDCHIEHGRCSCRRDFEVEIVVEFPAGAAHQESESESERCTLLQCMKHCPSHDGMCYKGKCLCKDAVVFEISTTRPEPQPDSEVETAGFCDIRRCLRLCGRLGAHCNSRGMCQCGRKSMF